MNPRNIGEGAYSYLRTTHIPQISHRLFKKSHNKKTPPKKTYFQSMRLYSKPKKCGSAGF
jgi:hypothetical protein